MENNEKVININVKHYKIKLTTPKKKKEKKIKKIIILLICIIFTLIVLYFLFVSLKNIILWRNDSKDNNKQADEIREQTNIEEIQDNDKTEIVKENNNNNTNNNNTNNTINNDYWYYVKFPLINVDFKELKKKNSDTVAWINVNNTNINYPVVQANDNEYYLNHSFNKQYNDAGWVFLDCRNNKDFSDKNSIIYAHSRLDKTMFGSLSKALKNSWYQNKDNHIIRISNEYENSLYQIFSVYVIQTENYYITPRFDTNKDYQDFLDIMKGRSIYNFNTNIGTNDRIITLSTCYDDDRKTVVHAKLIKRELRK